MRLGQSWSGFRTSHEGRGADVPARVSQVAAAEVGAGGCGGGRLQRPHAAAAGEVGQDGLANTL